VNIQATDFSLAHTLDSGQLFRWWPQGERCFVCVGERAFMLRSRDGRLEAEGAKVEDARFLRRLFARDTNLQSVRDELAGAGFPREILERWLGLRIVRQDLWECLVSFACSSANNIKRIRGMIDVMCLQWGDFARLDGLAFRTFPKPGALGNERELRKLGFGFRAAYLAAINKTVTPAWLSDVAGLSYAGAKARLMELPGVSHKIADCVCLFSLGHTQAFPVDTWIRRATVEMFFGGKKTPDAAIRELAHERFGHNAGYAQQYLFHEWRHRRK
jgi:N-glycosylase/DNA lyase